MGNIDCKCLKEFQQKEIITNKDQNMYSTNENFAESSEFKRVETINKKEKENTNIIKAKAKNLTTPGGEKNNQKEEEEEEEEEEIEIENPPMLNENCMDYAMDFFDEINKYRCDSDLFIDLKRRFPSKF